MTMGLLLAVSSTLLVLILWTKSVVSVGGTADDPTYKAASLLRNSEDPPLLENLELDIAAGRRLFAKLLEQGEHADKTNHVLDLLRYLETQQNLGACAPASAVTVLNAMQYRKPYDPTYTSYMSDAYAFWTQNAFIFDECVKKNLQSHVYGETLEGFGRVMKCLGLNVDVRHCVDGSKGSTRLRQQASDSCEDTMKQHLQQQHYVVANFERSLIHEKSGGHFSPVAGYIDGYFLVMDVARYKYPPVFVPTGDLAKAMARVDLQSGMSRGYVAIWRKK